MNEIVCIRCNQVRSASDFSQPNRVCHYCQVELKQKTETAGNIGCSLIAIVIGLIISWAFYVPTVKNGGGGFILGSLIAIFAFIVLLKNIFKN